MSGVAGAQRVNDSTASFNSLRFLIRLMMGQAAHVFPAQVLACTNSGENVPAGTVDVMPLINQLDAAGNIVPTSPVYGLPYFRYQAGTFGIILDPPKGDIGIVIVCDRDISSLKRTQAQAAPGSARRFNKADGVYVGGFMNGEGNDLTALTDFIQWLPGSGINIVTQHALTIAASNVTLDAAGNLVTQGNITGTGGSGTVDLNHSHGGVQSGSAQTDPPTGGT